MKFLKNLFMKDEDMTKVMPSNKGKVIWNNGVQNKMTAECPGEGWVKGRISKNTSIKDDFPDTTTQVISAVGNTEEANVSETSSINTQIGFFKVRANAVIPKFQTEAAAGFDLHAALVAGETITAYNLNNRKIEIPIKAGPEGSYFVALPGLRYLVPTGLIFGLERDDHMVEIHPRSGFALKQGIVLANCTGIIDSDYVEEVFVMTHNISDMSVVIKDGERIAQGIITRVLQPEIKELKTRPTQKTDRNGGFGSTGS